MSKLFGKVPTPEEKQAAKQSQTGCLVILGGIALLWFFVWLFTPGSPSEIEPPVQLAPSDDVREYADPRDRRWDNPSGREVIRAMAEEAGVSEEEMRKAANDELDRRGLSDWADGR